MKNKLKGGAGGWMHVQGLCTDENDVFCTEEEEREKEEKRLIAEREKEEKRLIAEREKEEKRLIAERQRRIERAEAHREGRATRTY